MSAHWFRPEEPVDRTWFWPLESFAAAVAADPRLPQVNPDHFFYVARVEREGFPVLHSYRHVGTKRYLNIDETGAAWRYTASDMIGSRRYALYDSIDDALAGAEVFRGNLIATHLRSMAATGVPVPVLPKDEPKPTDAARRVDFAPDPTSADADSLRAETADDGADALVPGLDDVERREAGFDADSGRDAARVGDPLVAASF
jgi:hypothetical protein